MRATRLVCFGGQKDGVEIGVLDREQTVELATFRQREQRVGGGVTVETYRVRLVYRRGKSPRSGRECLVFVGERE